MPAMRLSFGILLPLAQAVDFSSYTDESVSLLQLRAAVRESDDADLHDADDEIDMELLHATEDDAYGDLPGKPKLQPKQVGPFGPDGTWNTPYCKDIQGCIPYCPPGCDGAARWMWPIYPNTRLGVPQGATNMHGKLRHFTACEQGKRVPGALGAPPRVAWMNCLGSENATKAPLMPPETDELKENPVVGPDPKFYYPDLKKPGFTMFKKWSMTPYGYEFCPVDCVNDCAYFQHGNFNHCGVSAPVRGWTGYNRGNGPEVGSNPRCNTDYIWPSEINSYMWCGERTTTTPLPPPVEPEVDPGDEAAASGDPHITTITGHHFDVTPEA